MPLTFDRRNPACSLVSFDGASNRVAILPGPGSGLSVPAVREDGSWRVGTVSADELKDAFVPVMDSKRASILFHEAAAALSDKSNR